MTNWYYPPNEHGPEAIRTDKNPALSGLAPADHRDTEIRSRSSRMTRGKKQRFSALATPRRKWKSR